MILSPDILVLNDTLTRFFGVKQCSNDIFCLNDTLKLLGFIYSHSALLISFIFHLNGENLA